MWIGRGKSVTSPSPRAARGDCANHAQQRRRGIKSALVGLFLPCLLQYAGLVLSNFPLARNFVNFIILVLFLYFFFHFSGGISSFDIILLEELAWASSPCTFPVLLYSDNSGIR